MRVLFTFLAALIILCPAPLLANSMCEPAATDCRKVLLTYIQGETVGLDVGFEEMADTTIADAIIALHRARVRVRLIVEPRRNTQTPENGVVLDMFKAAGVPMRRKLSGSMLHWKTMIFAGQKTVEFGATNYTQSYLVPVQPYVNFTQDPIYFSTDPLIVNSFERKFDDVWTDTVNFVNFANVGTPEPAYPPYSIDASLNFVPFQNFGARSTPLYDAETERIDTIMYKITEKTHADGLIRAVKRGIPVRLIVEPSIYRSKNNVWQAYNVDRMYAAGVRTKLNGSNGLQIRVRAHAGFLHQKTTLLYSQGLTIFGSSNWTIESNKNQYEHNFFTTNTTNLGFFDYFRKVFERKWRNLTGNVETKAFVPLPPDVPVYVGPANASSGQSTSVTLAWKPGPWAHRADVYLGTSSPPPLYAKAVTVSPNTTGKLTVSGLVAGRTYYWQIVSKTMAGLSARGVVWSFGT
jgi:hypothetical protein